MAHPLFERHRALLDQALTAIAQRGYWSPFPESASPRNYGETANDEGKAAFEARRNQSFALDQPGTIGAVGSEISPYGMPLGIKYPQADLDRLLAGVQVALPSWRKAGPETWVGVCLEILQRINRRSFEMAYAVMHTTGQGFMMAFQAGGPHAQDRALEAIAYAWDEMRRVPSEAHWEKPQGKNPPLVLRKHYRIAPRGIAAVIGCCTFPTWNAYPGLFASLATGNAVIVKPHPGAILPLAITVEIARDVLKEAGFVPDVVTLLAHEAGDDTAQKLALRKEIGLIDFTGSTANGEWLERNARQAHVFTEKAGVNAIVVDSSDDFKGLVRNVAFSLSLYTGQMCTAPQNIFVPRDGIDTEEGHLSFAQVADGIAQGVQKLLSDPARAVEFLGAVQNDGVMKRLEAARDLGEIVLDTQAITHAQYPRARVRSPLIVKLDAHDEAKFMQEWFGPISFVIATDDSAHSLALVTKASHERGALTLSVYSTRERVLDAAREAACEAGVALSCNLTSGVYVNQSAAFSDFHGTGANPAANASLTDSAFVANRFRVMQWREHV